MWRSCTALPGCPVVHPRVPSIVPSASGSRGLQFHPTRDLQRGPAAVRQLVTGGASRRPKVFWRDSPMRLWHVHVFQMVKKSTPFHTCPCRLGSISPWQAEATNLPAKLKRISQFGLCCSENNVSLEFPSILCLGKTDKGVAETRHTYTHFLGENPDRL